MSGLPSGIRSGQESYLLVQSAGPREVRDGSIDTPTNILKNHDDRLLGLLLQRRRPDPLSREEVRRRS